MTLRYKFAQRANLLRMTAILLSLILLASNTSFAKSYLASGDMYGTIKIWEPLTVVVRDQDKKHKKTIFACKKTITKKEKGHKGTTYSVSWNQDGTAFISGSRDRTIKLWDYEGKHKKTISEKQKGHKIAVHSVTWNPKGTRFVSGDSYGNIKI